EAVRAGAQDFLVKSEVDGPVLAHALRLAIERNRLHAALLDLALVDDLTGLYNRRGFLTLATRDLRLARRGNETLLVAFADLDDLKGVNDTAGHAVGDRALRDTAALLRRTFRDSDLVARIGGDEYAVLVRHAATDSAGVLAERLKRQVRDFNRRAARPYQVSISLGFATHKASTLGSVAGLLDRADRALYRDKSVAQGERDRRAMQRLVRDPATDLFARIPHGTGQTPLREALVLADHTSYHLGQLVLLRRLLGAWKGD